jgi:hypothetical protein
LLGLRIAALQESADGTSRHFAAAQNLVATGGMADIGQARTNQARFMSTRLGSERGPATCFEGLATQVLRAHWTSRPHCTRYLARIAGQADSGADPRNITRYRGSGLSVHLARGTLRLLSSFTVEVKSPFRRRQRPLRCPNRGFKNCLILRKRSLLRHDDSLIAQKNSLFTNVGNLPLSL